jgi:two-component system chemotaxis response regulator CheB
VVVCDDSPFMRRTMHLALDQDPHIEVVAVARTGHEAIELCTNLRPDILTLDLELPDIDGLGVIDAVRELPLRVLVVSSYTGSSTTERAVDALAAGAVDVLGKPGNDVAHSVFRLRLSQLVRDIGTGSGRHCLLQPRTTQVVMPSLLAGPQAQRLLVIGASTGGPAAIDQVLSRLPADFSSPIIVVQHMPRGFTEPFARRLQRSCKLQVREAWDEAPLRAGTVLVAQSGNHLHVGADHIWIRHGEPVHGMQPAVDVTLMDAAATWGNRVTAIILTGIGIDGRAGATEVHKAGGRVIAESRESCAVYGMPRAIIEAGLADLVAPLHDMPELLVAEVMQ